MVDVVVFTVEQNLLKLEGMIQREIQLRVSDDPLFPAGVHYLHASCSILGYLHENQLRAPWPNLVCRCRVD